MRAQLDVSFLRHPRVANLPPEAVVAYISALLYCAEFETDGYVPDTSAANGPIREVLVLRGLWEDVLGGISVHDYLQWNPSHSSLQSKRDSKRIAGAMGAATRYAKEPVEGWFELFYETYPRKMKRVDAKKAFEQAIRLAPVTTIIAGAERLRDDPNLPEKEFIPYPATWLRAGGWDDDPLPPKSNGRVRGSVKNILDLADRAEGR